MNDQLTLPVAEAGGRKPVRLLDLILPLLAPLALTVAGLIAGVIIALRGARIGASTDEAQRIAAGLQNNFMFGQIAIGLVYVLMLVVIWLVARRRGPYTVGGYFARVRWRTILLAVVSGLGVAGFVLLAIWWLDQHSVVTFHTTKGEEELLMPHSLAEFGVEIAIVAIIAPFVEELYFRGLMLAWFRRWLWLPLAALANAAIFALVHGRYVNHPGPEGWILTVMVGLVGLINVIWFVRSRSLWPSFVTHAFYNATLVTLAYLGGG